MTGLTSVASLFVYWFTGSKWFEPILSEFVFFFPLATAECSRWPKDLGRCCEEAEASVSVDASVCVCVYVCDFFFQFFSGHGE